MNDVCSCKATPGTPASTIFKFLNFHNHREHVYNNLWKFHRNRMNGRPMCSYRESATPGTPASTIFKFPKPPRECLQQLVKASSQSDERCVLLQEKCNTGCSDYDFSPISKVKCAKFHQDRNVGQHRILQVVQFLIFLNFQNHREHVSNNLWKFHRNRINAMCSCMATPGTPASTIFIFNF